MQDKQLKGVQYKTGFFILAGLALLGIGIGAAATAFIWMVMTGKGIMELEASIIDPQYAGTIKLIQVVSVLLCMVIPAYIAARIVHKRPFQFLGFRAITMPRTLHVLALMLTALLVTSLLTNLTHLIPISEASRVSFQRMEDTYMQQVKAMITFSSPLDFILTLLILAVLPAFAEEMLFRGGLQNLLARWTGKAMLAVLIISILFSLIHFSFFGFLTRMFLGFVLGIIYHYTQNLWYCVMGHFFNNALAVLQFYYYTRSGKDISKIASDDIPVTVGLIGLPVFIWLLILLKKRALPPEDYGQVSDEFPGVPANGSYGA